MRIKKMHYYVTHATPTSTTPRQGIYDKKIDAMKYLRAIRKSCVEKGTPSKWIGDECLQVSEGTDMHYFNVMRAA
jgi:hypothetical protein